MRKLPMGRVVKPRAKPPASGPGKSSSDKSLEVRIALVNTPLLHSRALPIAAGYPAAEARLGQAVSRGLRPRAIAVPARHRGTPILVQTGPPLRLRQPARFEELSMRGQDWIEVLAHRSRVFGRPALRTLPLPPPFHDG